MFEMNGTEIRIKVMSFKLHLFAGNRSGFRMSKRHTFKTIRFMSGIHCQTLVLFLWISLGNSPISLCLYLSVSVCVSVSLFLSLSVCLSVSLSHSVSLSLSFSLLLFLLGKIGLGDENQVWFNLDLSFTWIRLFTFSILDWILIKKKITITQYLQQYQQKKAIQTNSSSNTNQITTDPELLKKNPHYLWCYTFLLVKTCPFLSSIILILSTI